MLDLAKLGDVMLVTGNARDFAEDAEGTTLHSDLRAELARSGLPEDRIRVSPSVKEFLSSFLPGAPGILEAFKARLEGAEFRATFELGLREAIDEAIGLHSLAQQAEAEGVGWLGEAYFTLVHDIVLIDAQDIRIMTASEVLVDIYVEAESDIDVYVSRRELGDLPTWLTEKLRLRV